MTTPLALAWAVAALLAWWIGRSDPSHRPLLAYFGGLAALAAAHALLARLGHGDVAALETARVAFAAFGLWAIARVGMEARSAALPLALGAAMAVAGLAPDLGALRTWGHEAAWAMGTLGAIWSTQRAMRGEMEPRRIHLLLLGLTALGATRLAVGSDGGPIVHGIAAGGAIAAQGVGIAGARRERMAGAETVAAMPTDDAGQDTEETGACRPPSS